MAHPVCPRLGDALEGAARSRSICRFRARHLPGDGRPAIFPPSGKANCIGPGLQRDRHDQHGPRPSSRERRSFATRPSPWSPIYDCWHSDHDAVTVDAIVKVLFENADTARALVRKVVPLLGAARGPCPAGCDRRALEYAIIDRTG